MFFVFCEMSVCVHGQFVLCVFCLSLQSVGSITSLFFLRLSDHPKHLKFRKKGTQAKKKKALMIASFIVIYLFARFGSIM